MRLERRTRLGVLADQKRNRERHDRQRCPGQDVEPPIACRDLRLADSCRSHTSQDEKERAADQRHLDQISLER